MTQQEFKETSREIDGHPRWQVTLYTMWAAQLLAIVGFSFVMPFIPFYVRELGVEDENWVPIWSGLVLSAGAMTMSVAAPMWGWVADRYGRKPMVQRAMFGGAVVLTLMGFAKSVPQLFVLRLMQGTITGTVSASIALVSSVVPKKRIGYSLGLMQMAVFTGLSMGPYLGGTVAEHFGYRVPFWIAGSLLLTGGVLVLFGARERFTRPAPEETEKTGALSEVLLVPGVLVLLALYFLMHFSGAFVGPIFPLFVEKIISEPGRAASQTGLILMVNGISAALASVIIGRHSDRLGHRRVLVSCALLAGLMSFPQAMAHSVGQLVALRALFGIGIGGMIPAMNATVTTIVHREGLGRAYGLTTTATAIGMASGPILGGWAASALGVRVPFVVMGAMFLLLTVVLATRRKIHKTS
jgi:DHA1 family multidrug resistance protein-like MFS transporter